MGIKSSLKQGKNILKKKHKDDKKDYLISIAIMSPFVVLSIQALVLFYFNLVGTTIGSQIQLTSKGVVGLFFLLPLPYVLKKNTRFLLAVYSLALTLFLINFLIFPRNRSVLQSISFPFFFTCLSSYVYSYSINNKLILWEIMRKASNIIFSVSIIIIILVFTGIIQLKVYSQALSYYMLLPLVMNIYMYVSKKSYSSLFKIILLLVGIIGLGSRGAIMSMGIYAILLILLNAKRINYKTMIVGIPVLFSIGVAWINFRRIARFFYEFLLDKGIYSRTLWLFFQDGIHLSNREDFYEVVLQEIVNNPIIGIGLAGDRNVLGIALTGDRNVIGYTHNIFLEIISGFGIIIGFFLILGIVCSCLISLSDKRKLDANIVLIWFSIGFVPLLVSGSYLTDFQFWIFLGLAHGGMKMKIKKKYDSD